MKKKIKKRAAAAAMTVVASASVLVGGAFENPADLLGEEAAVPTAITRSANYEADEAAGSDDDSELEERRKGGFQAAVRRWVLGLPLAVRALVGVPLWCLGWGLLRTLMLLWPVVSPAADALLRWSIMALILLAVFTFTAKTMFPDLPLRSILRKRTVSGLFGLVVVLGLVDWLVPYCWDGYERFKEALQFTGAFVVVLVMVWLLAVRELRRRERFAEREEEAELSRDEIHRRALELADQFR